MIKKIINKLMKLKPFEIFLLFLLVMLAIVVNNKRIVFDWRSRALGANANIIVYTGEVGFQPRNSYRFFAQGGEERGNFLEPVLPKVSRLKPKIIRIDHIYDYFDMVKGEGGSISLNFSKLDSVVDTIVRTGAVPMLSLSYMPSSIAVDGNITNNPRAWSDWQEVVQRTIEHYSGKDAKNLKNVWYEVWNEPDLFGGFKTYGEKNYLNLYNYAAAGAQSAKNVSPFFIGGPATTELYRSWIDALSGSGSRVDFISWHRYSTDPTRFAKDFKEVSSWLSSYPRLSNVPLVISESGFTSEKNIGYKTAFSAIHTAALIRKLLDFQNVYLFTFQLKDGPNQESGEGWGLISHESLGAQTKPRYHIFSFIDSVLGPRLKLTGEGTWVSAYATRLGNSVKVLLINYDPEYSHTEMVPVTIVGLPKGVYRVSERRFLGSQTSVSEIIDSSSYGKEVLMPANSAFILELKYLQGEGNTNEKASFGQFN